MRLAAALKIRLSEKTVHKAKRMDCVKQYPEGTLHADGGKLFCPACNVMLDLTRKNSIDWHLESEGHLKRNEEEGCSR